VNNIMMFLTKPDNKQWFRVVGMMHLGVFIITYFTMEFCKFSAVKICMSVTSCIRFFSSLFRGFIVFSPQSHITIMAV
jgi:hypothetical protein